MKMSMMVRNVVLVAASFFGAQVALGAAKPLIELEGGKPKAALAKSWKKLKDGEYEFELDTTQEVKKGVTVAAEHVKSSLEGKLGSTHGVKVTDKGSAKVGVTYTGPEQKFLEAVAKTKIRSRNVEIALESSTSEGGIRAKKTERAPKDGEVKVIVLKGSKGVITGKVNASKSSKIKTSTTVKFKGDEKKFKKNDKVFFVPEKLDQGVWVPKAGTLE